MKIAILGTKGIPNNYGGYEQFAEYISVELVKLGHSVTVYNPNYHPYSETKYNGVNIVSIFSPENVIGSAANFIYDHLCLKHALKQDFDIIYEAGYHSVALSLKLLRVKNMTGPVLITNMDGLEWKRSKWNSLTRRLIKALEKIAINHSPYLISDNEGIRNYYLKNFNRDSFFIPYGAELMKDPDETHLIEYDLKIHEYFMLIARLEPENNIEPVVEGYLKSASHLPLIIIGNHNTSYGKFLKNKFHSANVRFVGGIYDKGILDSLRYFSKAYFHGHSVGGTNPSLLEAMACECLIMAHDNEFNKSVLSESAFYFKNSDDVMQLVQNVDTLRLTQHLIFSKKNLYKTMHQYSWKSIVKEHENLFLSLLSGRSMNQLDLND